MITNLKRRAILLIDPDQQALTLASIVMSTMANCEVHGCRNGAEAQALAASVNPDLIMLGICGADSGALATLESLRALANTRTAPAILLVDDAAVGAPRCEQSLGVIGEIARSVKPLALPERVLQLWERHMQR